MINQDTACTFACCYDNKEGHLPAHLAKPAIFPYVRVETGFVYLLFKGGMGNTLLNSSFGQHGMFGRDCQGVQLYHHNIQAKTQHPSLFIIIPQYCTALFATNMDKLT